MARELTYERLKAVLAYDANTGEFFRLLAAPHLKIGQIVGGVDRYGYLRTSIDNRSYLLHRLAWFYATGSWPKGVIDHINHNIRDNSFSNLRDVSIKHNVQHSIKASKNNSVGYLGVHIDARRKTPRWIASIVVDGKQIGLGRYSTPTQAHECYLMAKSILHDGYMP